MTTSYLLDWFNILLRGAHVVFVIAWIGSSFYFVWLDNHLTPPDDPVLKDKGVGGELWAVHGGGFYNPQKYPVGPKRMPGGELHWFYWESYSTWMSGLALFTVLYLFNATTFLIDRNVHIWSAPAAIVSALGFLVAGWVLYDAICRFAGRNRDGSIGGDGRVAALIFIVVVAASWLACHLFAGRAAFLIVGAMLATIMSANVFFWIIPGQRKVVADLAAGRRPDPIHGQRGKQRSVHNTYFTLPVLVAMLSNHYGMLTSAPSNWLVLVGLMLMGAMARLVFVLRHKGTVRWPLVGVCSLLLVGLVWLVLPPTVVAVSASPAVPTFAEVQAVVQQRCVMCHNDAVFNKDVRLNSAALIHSHSQQIFQQVVVTRAMPFGNATGITEGERLLIKRWVEGGAP